MAFLATCAFETESRRGTTVLEGAARPAVRLEALERHVPLDVGFRTFAQRSARPAARVSPNSLSNIASSSLVSALDAWVTLKAIGISYLVSAITCSPNPNHDFTFILPVFPSMPVVSASPSWRPGRKSCRSCG